MISEARVRFVPRKGIPNIIEVNDIKSIATDNPSEENMNECDEIIENKDPETKDPETKGPETGVSETKGLENKGTGAGGSNTNYYGKQFEEKTNNEARLLEQGFVKRSLTSTPKKTYDYYLSKTTEEKTITFVLQNGLKKYMKRQYDIEMFRCPDEAYIIEYKTGKVEIKILEKKEQRVEGSVETKLWSGPSLKREYEIILGSKFEVSYGFCLSSFLKSKLTSNEKKYTTLQQIMEESNIICLFGDDADYFEKLDNWLLF